MFRIPLHGNPDVLDKLGLWANMSTMNPSGFRNLSTKKNKRRKKSNYPNKVGINGRYLSRPEQLEKRL